MHEYHVILPLGIGKVKPTSIFLQLVDRSIIYSRGIIEDASLRSNASYFLLIS